MIRRISIDELPKGADSYLKLQTREAYEFDGLGVVAINSMTALSEEAFVWVWMYNRRVTKDMIRAGRLIIKYWADMYPRLFAMCRKNCGRDIRFAEFFGFEIDKQRTYMYHNREYVVLRYKDGRASKS